MAKAQEAALSSLAAPLKQKGENKPKLNAQRQIFKLFKLRPGREAITETTATGLPPGGRLF